MNAGRLEVLAKFLETEVPKRKFDMRIFVIQFIPFFPKNAAWCGARACALGWCPIVPEFADQGWRYNQDGKPVVGEDRNSFTSAERFFGMEPGTGDELFAAHGGARETPQQVAARIRDFVKQHAEQTAREPPYSTAKWSSTERTANTSLCTSRSRERGRRCASLAGGRLTRGAC